MVSKHINKYKDSRLLARLKKDNSTLNGAQRLCDGKELIVSLTTIPSRLSLLDLTFNALLSQSIQPTKIILWISDSLEYIPENIQSFVERGITVERCQDVGPHTKLVHALKEYPDAVIVTADDDTLYPKDWLEKLVNAYRNDATAIHCHRAHYINFTDDGELEPYLQWDWLSDGVHGRDIRLFPTGVGGVLYPPKSLHSDTTNLELLKKLSPRADDIWFKFMALLNGTTSSKVNSHFREFLTVDGSQENAKLGPENVGGGGNDRQLKACFEHYGIKYSILKQEFL